MKMCARCKKRPATVYIMKLENNVQKQEGLCLVCAKELGIKPVNDMMKKMGISEDDLETLNNEMMSAFGGAEGLESLFAQPDSDDAEDDDDNDDND